MPPDKVRPPGGEAGGREDKQQRAAGGRSVVTLPRAGREPVHVSECVETYLRSLVALCDDPPLIHELTEADLGTPRGTSSIARAALAWYREGLEEELRRRLEEELRHHDLLARWRIRMAGHDVRGTTDWVRVFDVVQARRGAA